MENIKYDSQSEELKKILDKAYKNQRPSTLTSRSSYWFSKKILRHINNLAYGKIFERKNENDANILNAAQYFLLKEKISSLGKKSLALALSIGCGSAEKEMYLLQQNIVDVFHCFELSKERIEQAKNEARRLELLHRIEFHHCDFFTSAFNKEESYDFVFWDGALHHMQNTKEAVQISYKILKKHGIFYCNDYIGPSYYQWSDSELAIVNSVLAKLPEKIFENPNGGRFPSKVWRPTIEQMKAADPTEAVDSGHIKEAILESFTHLYYKDLGGLLYLLALNNILVNIEEESPILDYILKLDEHTISLGLSQFAFFLAVKD